MTNLKKIIDEKGVQQRWLAEQVGVTEVSMSRYVSGERIPKAPLAIRMADALGVDVKELYGWEPEKRTEERTETHGVYLDVIRRQDAIDAIHCDITITGRQNAALVATTIGAFVDRIKALPPAEPAWIPCSERLPKEDGRYQVTRHDYVTNTEFIDILWYEKNLWWNKHSTGDYAVTAWMPLPEPYREGEQDENR